MLREMEALFGRMFWNNVIIGVSFWPYDEASVARRKHHGITEAKLIRECNKQLAENGLDAVAIARRVREVLDDSTESVTSKSQQEAQA